MAIGALKINDSPGLTIEDIASKCRKVQSEAGNLGAVFIDHIHLMRDRKGRHELEKLTHITAEIKNLAKELNCSFLPLAQLNRGTESRDDKHPQMSDIRSSGSSEQDADVIIGFYRDDYYRQSDQPKDGICELGVLKNRGGKTGTVKLHFEAPFTRFQNFSTSRSSFVHRPAPPPDKPQVVEREVIDRALETTLGDETPW
jgi:replicative DNA helicase